MIEKMSQAGGSSRASKRAASDDGSRARDGGLSKQGMESLVGGLELGLGLT